MRDTRRETERGERERRRKREGDRERGTQRGRENKRETEREGDRKRKRKKEKERKKEGRKKERKTLFVHVYPIVIFPIPCGISLKGTIYCVSYTTCVFVRIRVLRFPPSMKLRFHYHHHRPCLLLRHYAPTNKPNHYQDGHINVPLVFSESFSVNTLLKFTLCISRRGYRVFNL